MIFRSNAGLVAIILLELILAGALTRFAIDLPGSPPPAADDRNLADAKGQAPDEYILLVAATFQSDHDLALARERLGLFQDDDIIARVSQLALTYASQNKRQAKELAALAVALGSTSQTVSLLATDSAITSEPKPPTIITTAMGAAPTAALLTTPTPFRPATLTRIPATSTRKPTATATRTRTAIPSPTKTIQLPSATLTQAPSTPTSTATPTATPSLTAASSGTVTTDWLPDRSQWPPGMGFQAAAPSTGQQYWRLVRALYCDYTEQRFDCPSRPGGPAGTNTYVMLIDSAGNRTEAPLLLNGGPSGQEQKAASDMCNCNYSFPDDDWSIQVGSATSDIISGLGLYSVKFGLRQYHVRYFLTFQLLTK